MAECWGKVLTGMECRQGTEQPIGRSSIVVKFCASCQHHGLWVPVERVRVLPPTVRLDNTASNGVWSTAHTNTVPPYRVCNQTRRCTGPRVVIFSEPPPSETPESAVSAASDLGGVMGWPLGTVSAELMAAAASTANVSGQPGSQTWDAIPEQWNTSRNEHGALGLHMKLAHGTLVPEDRRRKVPRRTAREPAPPAAASSDASTSAMPPPAVPAFSAAPPLPLPADPTEGYDLDFLDSVLSEDAEGGSGPSPGPSPPEPSLQVQLLTERVRTGDGLWGGWNGFYVAAALVAALAAMLSGFEGYTCAFAFAAAGCFSGVTLLVGRPRVTALVAIGSLVALPAVRVGIKLFLRSPTEVDETIRCAATSPLGISVACAMVGAIIGSQRGVAYRHKVRAVGLYIILSIVDLGYGARVSGNDAVFHPRFSVPYIFAPIVGGFTVVARAVGRGRERRLPRDYIYA